MSMMFSGGVWRMVCRNPLSRSLHHLGPGNCTAHHPTPTPQLSPPATPHAQQYSCAPPLPCPGRVVARWRQLPWGRRLRESTRSLHTGGRKYDQSSTTTASTPSASTTTTPSASTTTTTSASTTTTPSATTTSRESNVVRDVLDRWTHTLEAAQVPEASLSAQHIVAHVLRVTRCDLARPSIAETAMTREQAEEVERMTRCRLERMPLQYILGEWDFHNITLKVVPPVFIPRPETEHLVELAISILKEMESPKVLEFCCGSGAVSLALLNALPQVECVAVDQSKHAVGLTEGNAALLGLRERLTVVKGKLTMDGRPPLPHTNYDLLVANPPYVLRKDLMDLPPEIMMYEDLRALDGGADGLNVIKSAIRHADHLLLPGRKLLMEVDPCHPYLLPNWLEKQNLDLKLVKVHQDFNKKDRYLEFIKKP